MDCLTFRRLKSSAPRDVSPEMSRHTQGCEACASFARDIDEFELRLEEAVRIRVPDGLAEAIILRHRRPQRPSRARQWLQIAASRWSHGWSSIVLGGVTAAVIVAVV